MKKLQQIIIVVFLITLFPMIGVFAEGPPLVPTGGGGYIDPQTGTHYAPTGDGGLTNTRNGTYYAPAGPTGVTNTRTGRHVVIEPDYTKSNVPNNTYPHGRNYSDDYDSDENE